MYIIKKRKIKIKTPYTRDKAVEILQQNINDKGLLPIASNIMASCAIFRYSFEIALLSRRTTTLGAYGKFLIENNQTIIELDMQNTELYKIVRFIQYFSLVLLQSALLLDKSLTFLHFIPTVVYVFLVFFERYVYRDIIKITTKSFLDMFDGETTE